jgi:hypothetical protein
MEEEEEEYMEKASGGTFARTTRKPRVEWHEDKQDLG